MQSARKGSLRAGCFPKVDVRCFFDAQKTLNPTASSDVRTLDTKQRGNELNGLLS